MLSVAMIVKNESDRIAECLEHLAGVADEICVLDTGSEDDTRDIAQRFGCRCGTFAWCDDFAAARNASLDLCTGDWIFVIDPDERIDAHHRPKIRSLAEGPTTRCYRFITRNYTDKNNLSDFSPCAAHDGLARGFAGWYPSGKVRLFPNQAGIRFEGGVHELVNQSLLSAGIEILTCDIPIHHYPLLKTREQLRSKQHLYLKLGLQKVRENPRDPRARTELGDQYAELGDYARAAAAYREAVRLAPRDPGPLADLGAVLHILGKREEAEDALKIAVKLDPARIAAWRNLGVIAFDRQDWSRAIHCFERALAIDPKKSDLYRCLAAALEGAGRLEEAAGAAQKALERDPNSSDALSCYIDLAKRLNERDAARAFLENLATKGMDGPDFAVALRDLA